jgi:GNAT superfamily N-acetyltransferase|nr:MAG: GCN5 family acetyltransferase [Vulcanisaeta sp. AZ3]
MINVFGELSRNVLTLIRKSYLKYPASFAYLFYDIIYYPELTDAYINMAGNDIVGFILIFNGLRCTAVHVIGNVSNPINYIPPSKCLDILVNAEPKLVNQLVSRLSRSGYVEQRKFLTMICSGSSFREFHVSDGYVIRRIMMKDLRELMRIKGEQGVQISEVEAIMRLLSPHWHYYGAFLNEELVSIATAYLKLPEIWIIGEVYTIPNHRNKGLAKAVTSAITKDAINSGAMAMLHVYEENQPAIQAYRRIGYVAIQQLIRIQYKS